MVSIHARCDGVFIGHALVSHFDVSTQMAQQLSESLLELKHFDGSNIMARYLYLYHTKKCDYGQTMNIVCQNLKDKMKNNQGDLSICREDFLFDQCIINETVKLTDSKLGGLTAGCGPAHRSFPLALCPWIDDDDLFDLSNKEAALTHYSPLAGQVAGIVNLICRSLIRNNTWYDAVRSAFATPSLHIDVSDIYLRYSRWSTASKETHPAYAPTVLNEALHYITTSDSAAEAIKKANAKGNFYCLPVIGILSGARWGVSLDMYKDKVNDPKLKTIRDTADKLSNLWTSKYDSVQA